MAVPLSPQELLRKRSRSSSTNRRRTAPCSPAPTSANSGSGPSPQPRHRPLYDKLGLAEYEAIEGFVRWKA